MRTRAILFLAILGIGVAMMPTRAQQPGDQGRDEELMILQLRIEAERARVMEAEARLHQAVGSLARLDRLSKVGAGAVSEEEVGQVRGEVEIRKAQLQVQQIALKEAEVRLQQAKRSQSEGGATPPTLDRRLAEMDRKLDQILKELEGLKGR
jgi:multidrug resistance efflux pump